MSPSRDHPFDLQAAAVLTMRDNGFEPVFPPAVQQQLDALLSQPPLVAPGAGIRDLRALLWSSIDNETTRDLDQVEVVERLPDGDTRVLVGIADVDAFVPRGSAIDVHAAGQTTTVYTGVRNFAMLPEALSTDATSLREGADKLVVVVEFVVGGDGAVRSSEAYRALVRNRAQMAYDEVGAWLEARGPVPRDIASAPALQAQVRLQDEVAQALKQARFRHGALNIETIEIRPVTRNERVAEVVRQQKNNATELIEEFMIASNEVVARLLEHHGVSSIRRVVKTPKRWDRIVDLAAALGAKLPTEPDSLALNEFLLARRVADPSRFADLSLAVIKLMGPGEYAVERKGDPDVGHFGLAVQDYTHATAPNRRYADLVTQRLLKAVIAQQPPPYSDEGLATIARNCTLRGDAARKVERTMTKRIAALAMSDRVGERFDAMVTGVTAHGTFVRVLHPAVEGMLARGQDDADVGDRMRVRLMRTDVERGYIDFERV